LIDDETLAALPAPLGNQCRSLIQAAEKIRRAAGSDADRVQLEAQQVRVAQALATNEGRLIPEVEFTRNPLVSNSTSEHQVRRGQDDGRAIKRTNSGFFGQVPFINQQGIVDRRAALPSEYLDRTALQLAVFGGDIEFKGVSIVAGPSFVLGQSGDQPAFIISQLWYEKAREVRAEEVDELMRDQGFVPVKNGYYAWYRPADRVLVTDARTDNFIATEDGVIPIDLQLTLLSPEEAAKGGLPQPPNNLNIHP
jgi:hypothetical protein